MRRQAVFYRLKESHREPAREWLESISHTLDQARIYARIARAENGNLGDFKAVSSGVFELRFHFGPGYRLYFGLDAQEIILLLIGGDQSSQVNDIQKAVLYWGSYQEEKSNA